MEGNLSQEGMVAGGASFGGLDLQGSMRVNFQAQHQHAKNRQTCQANPSVHEGFPITMETICHHSDQSLSMTDYNKGDRCKSSMSDDDEPSYNEEGADGHNDTGKGKKGSPWQRVKWTDKMVRLMITAVSYIGEDVILDCGGGIRRKSAVMQKKGKWKLVSDVMAERGFHVSPQQCEDKFNDLNKRYKKLNDMLGRGISCQVVENPALLDVIDYITEKEKDDVRKILSSKHLFYEEMCSYHNGNRLHLPHDPALKRSLQFALRSRDDHDNDDSRKHQLDLDEDYQDMEIEDRDEFDENHASYGDSLGACGVFKSSSKRLKQGPGQEDVCFGNFTQDGNKGLYSHPQIVQDDINQISLSPENAKTAWLQKQQWLEFCTLRLEEQKVQIQAEKLELETQWFKWQRFSKKRNCELEKMRMENERMKLENERMTLELKRREMEVNFN